MLNPMTTSFVDRLRRNDEAAWFELWETFGPVLRAQLTKWGNGRIGRETVRDLSQETMAALSNSIDRYDPSKGARFSTWLLAIAKHVLGDELDKRMAKKRGGGRRAADFDECHLIVTAQIVDQGLCCVLSSGETIGVDVGCLHGGGGIEQYDGVTTDE